MRTAVAFGGDPRMVLVKVLEPSLLAPETLQHEIEVLQELGIGRVDGNLGEEAGFGTLDGQAALVLPGEFEQQERLGLAVDRKPINHL